jgi:hypothetical protein
MSRNPTFELFARPDTDDAVAALNASIRGAIASRRFSQLAVARALDISAPSLSKRLDGLYRWRVEELFQLAGVLGMSVGDVVPVPAIDAALYRPIRHPLGPHA